MGEAAEESAGELPIELIGEGGTTSSCTDLIDIPYVTAFWVVGPTPFVVSCRTPFGRGASAARL